MSKLKPLQSNFTTPEQSNRLMKLGVPVDSADCYFGSYTGHPDWAVIRQSDFDTEDDALFRLNEDIIPCWSVGRLIEIFELCTSSKFERVKTKCSVLEDILWQIETYVTETSKGFSIDFFKLEE